LAFDFIHLKIQASQDETTPCIFTEIQAAYAKMMTLVLTENGHLLTSSENLLLLEMR
jgi:hypothetical protein